MINPDSRVTLRKIAEELGVSLTTISLALRDAPRISLRRRKQVKKIAERMGYQRNAMATALVHCRRHQGIRPITAELAWINNWQDPRALRRHKELDLCWHGATRAAEKRGFRLQEFVVDRSLTFSRLEQILRSRNIQGIVIPPHGYSAITAPDRLSLDWQRYATVRLGYSVKDLPAHVVTGNHLHGALLAFSSIHDKGYHRIGYVCSVHTSARSKAGFLMAQTSVSSSQRVPMLQLDLHDDAARRTAQLIEWLEENKPDAILTELAELPQMLVALGHRVPQDIGLATTSILDGRVDSGIYQHSEEIGRIAVETVVDMINRNDLGLPQLCREILVDSSWRDGASLPPRVDREAALRG